MKGFYILTICLFFQFKAYTCTCLHPTIEESFKSVDHIFTASVELIDSIKRENYYEYIFEINADIQFKGTEQSKFYYQTNGNSCNLSRYFFHSYQQYLLYFNEQKPKNDTVFLSSCDRNVGQKVLPQHLKHISRTNFNEDLSKLYSLNPNPKQFKRHSIEKNKILFSLIILIALIGIIVIFMNKEDVFKRGNRESL